MWAAAILVYLRVDGSRLTTAGRVAFWSLVAISTVLWASGPWSPPPPSERALGWFALIGWILVPWAALADRRRAVVLQ